MKEYFGIQGFYADKKGNFKDEDHQDFLGVIELENKVSHYTHPTLGEMEVQYFWGAERERPDIQKCGVASAEPLVFGAFQTQVNGGNGDRAMAFVEITNDADHTFDPMVYNLIEKGEGIYEGVSFVDPTALEHETVGNVATYASAGVLDAEQTKIIVECLTPKEVREYKLREFLKDAYIQNLMIGYDADQVRTIKKLETARKALFGANSETLKHKGEPTRNID